MRNLGRTVWEDRATFGASRDFFKRWNRILDLEEGAHGWSMEHMIFKQRWYRGAGAKAIRKSLGDVWGGRAVKALKGLGDSGWNVVPVPMRFNRMLYSRPVLSAFFNYGFYPVGAGVVYGGYKVGEAAGEKLAKEIIGE